MQEVFAGPQTTEVQPATADMRPLGTASQQNMQGTTEAAAVRFVAGGESRRASGEVRPVTGRDIAVIQEADAVRNRSQEGTVLTHSQRADFKADLALDFRGSGTQGSNHGYCSQEVAVTRDLCKRKCSRIFFSPQKRGRS